VYGSGPQQLTSNTNRMLTVTVPALSAVVYESAQRIPRSDAAPRISLDNPTISTESNSRMLVSANVGGSSFNEVTFYAKVGNGEWESVGTDDTRQRRSPAHQ
jgi:alpha-amylase